MKKIDMTQGSVLKVIMLLAIPLVGSSLLQFTYNFIDMLWVGGLGSGAIAAVGTASFFINLGYALTAVVVVGTGSKVAFFIGKKEEEKTKEMIHGGMFFNLIIASIYLILILLFSEQLIGFFDLGNVFVEEDAGRYLKIGGVALFFSLFNILFSRILGSYGQNKKALYINSVGIVINMILDPLLIYVFKFGVAGAALATLFGNMLVFVLFVFKTKDMFDGLRLSRALIKSIKEIARIGLPMSIQRVIFTAIGILLAKIIARFGPDAIAAQKIGIQLESITLMVVGGFNGAIASFVGQNMGAKKYERVEKGYHLTLALGIGYALLTTTLFLLIPDKLAGLFVQDSGTIQIAVTYLRFIGMAQIFGVTEMISNGMFTGLGLAKVPAMISVTFTALRIPLALLLIPSFGVHGIWLSIALSSVIKGSIAYLIYRLKVWRKYETITALER